MLHTIDWYTKDNEDLGDQLSGIPFMVLLLRNWECFLLNLEEDKFVLFVPQQQLP